MVVAPTPKKRWALFVGSASKASLSAIGSLLARSLPSLSVFFFSAAAAPQGARAASFWGGKKRADIHTRSTLSRS